MKINSGNRYKTDDSNELRQSIINVLMLINSFNLGGAEKVSFDLTRELQKNDVINVVLCSIGAVQNPTEKEVFRSLIEQGITCISLNKPRQAGRVKALIDLNKIVNQYAIDIIHSNGQSPDFYSRVLRLINRRVFNLVTLHNTSGYSRAQEQIWGRFTDKYTAVSESAKEYGIDALKIKKPISVIENGIDTKQYSCLFRDKESKSQFTILSVGRVQKQKGYIEAVDLVAPFLSRHKEARWLIYGNNTEDVDYYQQFLNRIASAKIEGSVIFKGVSREPAEIFGQGDCFLLNSEYEGFGIAFIEAMAAGMPVFGRPVGVLPDIENEGGFYYNLDSVEVDKQLEDLHNGIRPANTILQKNQAIIQSKYSLEAKAEEYLSIYKELEHMK